MTDQPTTHTPLPLAQTSAPKAVDSFAAIQAVEKTLTEFTRAADVRAVYGAPLHHGEVVVLPAAEVLSVLGFGMGSGGGVSEGQKDIGGGGGGGGGGRTFARPVAAIIIEGNTARVEPIVDVTKIVLGLLTAVGFVFGMLGRMQRRKLKLQ